MSPVFKVAKAQLLTKQMVLSMENSLFLMSTIECFHCFNDVLNRTRITVIMHNGQNMVDVKNNFNKPNSGGLEMLCRRGQGGFDLFV